MRTVGFNFHVLVPLLAADTLHVGPEGFGFLSAAFGLGALVGALATATLPERELAPVRRSAPTSFGVFALLARAGSERVPRGRPALRRSGSAFTLFTANANALVQLGAPDHLRGRLIGLYLFAFPRTRAARRPLRRLAREVGGTTLAFAVAGGHVARDDRAAAHADRARVASTPCSARLERSQRE